MCVFSVWKESREVGVAGLKRRRVILSGGAEGVQQFGEFEEEGSERRRRRRRSDGEVRYKMWYWGSSIFHTCMNNIHYTPMIRSCLPNQRAKM